MFLQTIEGTKSAWVR